MHVKKFIPSSAFVTFRSLSVKCTFSVTVGYVQVQRFDSPHNSNSCGLKNDVMPMSILQSGYRYCDGAVIRYMVPSESI